VVVGVDVVLLSMRSKSIEVLGLLLKELPGRFRGVGPKYLGWLCGCYCLEPPMSPKARRRQIASDESLSRRESRIGKMNAITKAV